MIEYRRIRIADVEEMTRFAVSAIPVQRELRVSIDKVRHMVSFFATTAGHFQMAAFKDGKPVAALAAFVSEMPFHEKLEATIAFCFSTEPGSGYWLLRALRDFVSNHMLIRRVSWAMNQGFDDRLRMVAKRLGFTSEHPTLMLYKG